MKKKVLIGLTALMLALFPIVAAADGIIIIESGARGIIAEYYDFGIWPFSFDDRQTGYISSLPWLATDTSGDGEGWQVFIDAGPFVDGTDSIPVTVTGQELKVTLSQASVACVVGPCADVMPQSTAFGVYLETGAPTKLINTYDNPSEMGAWEFSPELDLKIPGGLLPGNYQSVFLVTIISKTP